MGLFNWAKYKEMPQNKDVKQKKEPPIKVFFGVLRRKFGRFMILGSVYFLAGLPTWAFMFFAGYALVQFHFIGADSTYQIWLPLMAACIPLIALISGPATMGVTYVLRNYAREQHAWGISDMLEKASKNYFQGMMIGLINSVVAFVLIYMYFYYALLGLKTTGGLHIVNYILIVVGFLFAAMRSYIYPMAVTYKLKLTELYRYSMALTFMKLPQNMLLQLFSFACCYVAIDFPNLGILLLALGGAAFLGFVNVFYTDRVLIANMDEANIKVYPEKEGKKRWF